MISASQEILGRFLPITIFWKVLRRFYLYLCNCYSLSYGIKIESTLCKWFLILNTNFFIMREKKNTNHTNYKCLQLIPQRSPKNISLMCFRKIPGRQLTHATENSTVQQTQWSKVGTEDEQTPDRLSINLLWTHTTVSQSAQQYCITFI